MTPPFCPHTTVCTNPSQFSSSNTSFQWPSTRQRLLAATLDGKLSEITSLLTEKELFNDGMTFPAPLVLPGDDLTLDSTPQTAQEWYTDEDRNPITRNRKTLYVIPSPDITKSVKPMMLWLNDHNRQANKPKEYAQGLVSPTIHDACDYIRAFFYGLDVKPLPGKFRWAPWDDYNGTPTPWSKYHNKKRRKNPTRIGLETPGHELVGVRCRPAPDGASAMQVNLDDVLDAVLESVPADAFAVIMLVDLDMYETDDDDEIFTGGRAYGASRIAAVNCYREHPEQLPSEENSPGNGEVHWWPAAHCADYVRSMSEAAIESAPRKRSKVAAAVNDASEAVKTSRPSGPLAAAIAAAETSRGLATESETLKVRAARSNWFARLMKTATHELGHCLGLDHCIYFACIAQGCASAAESLRQPAYLCPVCLEKVGWTILKGLEPRWGDHDVRRAWAVHRDEALQAACEKWTGGGMFDGLGAWLNEKIAREKNESGI